MHQLLIEEPGDHLLEEGRPHGMGGAEKMSAGGQLLEPECSIGEDSKRRRELVEKTMPGCVDGMKMQCEYLVGVCAFGHGDAVRLAGGYHDEVTGADVTGDVSDRAAQVSLAWNIDEVVAQDAVVLDRLVLVALEQQAGERQNLDAIEQVRERVTVFRGKELWAGCRYVHTSFYNNGGVLSTSVRGMAKYAFFAPIRAFWPFALVDDGGMLAIQCPNWDFEGDQR